MRSAEDPATPLRFDPHDAAFVADPYPLFAEMRTRDPVHRSPMGAWVLTRYRDVFGALEDERLGNAPARYAVVAPRNRERYVCADVAAHILPFLDPPQHTAPRFAISRGFHDRLRAAPPKIDELAEGLLSGWRGHEVRDVVEHFASPLAVSVIGSLLGVPLDDPARLERWSESFFYLFAAIPSSAVRDELDAALTEFRGFLGEIIRERRAAPRQDLISDLVAACDRGELEEQQLVDNCMLLFADGVENVDRAVGNAVHALLCHPEQLSRLRARPELLATAVDECLRFESPAQYIGRIAREDMAIGDTDIPAGSTVLLVLGSANRDPEAFERPDELDLARSPNPHLAFGRGRHSCVGGPLVELQLRAALRALLRRTSALEPAGDEVHFVRRPGHRWVERVPVRFTPA